VHALAFIVGRYLLGLGRRTHVAVVSAISFISLGLGAMALVLTLALLEGFQSTIRQQLREGGPHALLLPARGDKLPGGPWLSQLAQAHPHLSFRQVELGTGWLVALGQAIPVQFQLVPGLAQVEVDRPLAAKAVLAPGTEVTLVAPTPVLSPLGPVPRQLKVKVGAVVGGASRSEKGLLRLPAELGRQLLPQGGREEVQVFCGPSADPLRATTSLGPLPEGVRLVPFRQLHGPLLSALSLEKLLIGFGVSLILLVASLNLLCNLTMLAAEKRADMALFQALGWSPAAVARLFRTLGLAMGAVAGVGGTLLGGLLATLLHRTQAIPLPRGVFAVSHVPFAVTPQSLLAVLALTLLAAWLASWVPARASARQEVMEGLRGE
jgi:ABC-type lipoprotein release transport system permease subunit